MTVPSVEPENSRRPRKTRAHSTLPPWPVSWCSSDVTAFAAAPLSPFVMAPARAGEAVSIPTEPIWLFRTRSNATAGKQHGLKVCALADWHLG